MNDWIDGHCHLTLLDPLKVEGALERSRSQGVFTWIMGGIGPDDWRAQRELAKRHPGKALPCFGLHPGWVSEKQNEARVEGALSELERLLPEAAGFGELGLDHRAQYKWAKERQLEVFGRQLRLARRVNLPLFLHIVQAHGAALELMKECGLPEAGGLVHSFSGNPEIARRYLDLGLHLSIGAGVTHSGFAALKNSLAIIPADRLVLESDAPDGMADPSGLIQVAEAVGAFRRESGSSLLDRSRDNLKALFDLKA